MGSLLGSGVAWQRAHPPPLCDGLPSWEDEPPEASRPLSGPSVHGRLFFFLLSFLSTC